MARPFRFGLQSYAAGSGAEWRNQARMAEDLGYSCFLVADHYLGPGPALDASGHPVQNLAAIPAIAVAAEATSRIRVGARVMCVDYRNPVVLAKELATIDLFSEGRLEIGLGAGWLAKEYEAMGIPLDPPGTRIARLADVVKVVKACLAEGQVAVEGSSGVRAVGFEGVPKPVQQPHPPIMIGGGGRRVLELAAREADIVSINFDNRSGVLGRDSIRGSTAAHTTDKVRWVREAAGARSATLELEIGAYYVVVTDRVVDTAAGFAKGFGLTAEEALAHPHVLIGSIDGICDELERRREELGVSYVTVGLASAQAFAPVVARLAGR